MATWGARSQIKHISSAFYFWEQPDTPSPARLLLDQDGCLRAGKATEGTETDSHSPAACDTKLPSGLLDSQGPDPGAWLYHLQLV